jgi:ABC-type dipeptide/oligopeptide/nickel transport system permease subunit
MGKAVILIAPLVVLGIVVAGIVVMAIGGETNKKWSNVLMRYRVIAQAIAVGLLMLVIYSASQH